MMRNEIIFLDAEIIFDQIFDVAAAFWFTKLLLFFIAQKPIDRPCVKSTSIHTSKLIDVNVRHNINISQIHDYYSVQNKYIS